MPSAKRTDTGTRVEETKRKIENTLQKPVGESETDLRDPNANGEREAEKAALVKKYTRYLEIWDNVVKSLQSDGNSTTWGIERISKGIEQQILNSQGLKSEDQWNKEFNQAIAEWAAEQTLKGRDAEKKNDEEYKRAMEKSNKETEEMKKIHQRLRESFQAEDAKRTDSQPPVELIRP